MVVLDTDLFSLLERGNAESLSLQMRLEQIPAKDIATTISTYEEQMRGWLARASKATSTEKMVIAYTRLQRHIKTFEGVPILPFDEKAATEFDRLQHDRVRIGTMDLKIAAICLAYDALLLNPQSHRFPKSFQPPH